MLMNLSRVSTTAPTGTGHARLQTPALIAIIIVGFIHLDNKSIDAYTPVFSSGT